VGAIGCDYFCEGELSPAEGHHPP